jgi:hypothetical protein
MFGYVIPEKPEMKIKDYELFRAYYCGVCRAIGRRQGQLKRFMLSYDSSFLAVLLSAAAGERVRLLQKRCMAHPLKKRNMVDESAVVDYVSDINTILAYYNLEDKKRDEASIVPASALIMLKRSFKRLRRQYEKKCGIMEKLLDDLVRLEKEKCASMDMAAEPFARLMEEVMAYEPLCGDENTEKALRWTGYNLGKWIYLLDAFDDLEKDIKKGSYNPLIYQYGYEGQDIAGFRDQIRARVEFNLTYSLSEISKAFELLDITINRDILENIIYLGMLRKTENILLAGREGKVEKSV